MNFKLESKVQELTLGSLNDGELAIVTDGEFAGELFFKNVAGLHGISGNRYWPSGYLKSRIGSDAEGFYTGPLSTRCNRVLPGDTLHVEEEK